MEMIGNSGVRLNNPPHANTDLRVVKSSLSSLCTGCLPPARNRCEGLKVLARPDPTLAKFLVPPHPRCTKWLCLCILDSAQHLPIGTGT